MTEINNKFFDRVDEFIQVANQQLASNSKGEVSASLVFAASRFNAWLSATGFNNAKEMEDARAETIEYFTTEFKKKLIENLDDHIKNFDDYMKG